MTKVYDEKGRLKTKIDLDVEGIELEQGDNNLRVSAGFSSDADIKLEGYVRLKNKVDEIKSK